MDKRYAHHVWTKLRPIKPLYVFIIFVLLAGLSVYEMRANNLHMADLRNQVYAADKSGKGVDTALQDLRAYVGQHMNTSLSSGQNGVYPPVQLKYTYDRLITAKSSSATDFNSQIYTDAQHYCEAQIPTGFSGRYRISCIQNYVKKHNASLTFIDPALYEFDFYSPKWSPDLAGLSLVLTILTFVGFLALVVIRRLFKHQGRK
jgi:hypothetical protein